MGSRASFPPEIRDAVPEECPSIQAVAAMPYPLSVATMRRFHNPNWGIDDPDHDELKTFNVCIRYRVMEYDYATYTVQAATEEQADELALAEFEREHDSDDEPIDSEISLVGDA